MKLFVAADIFPPQIGGPATYAVTLANELTKQGVEVTIVSLNPESDKSVVSCNLYLVSFKNKLFRYLNYIWLLFRYSKNVDVMYAMGPVNAGLPALIVSFLRRKKLVVKVVGDYAWEQYQNAECKIQNAEFITIENFQKLDIGGKVGWLKRVEGFVARHADIVITPCEYLKNIVAGWGAKVDRVRIVYNAVDFKMVEPINKPISEIWIVSIGRLVPWKGMDMLIDVVADIVKEFPHVRLKIIGGGPEEDILNSKVKSQKLGNSVEVVGDVPHGTALSYINTCDLFVLNSGYEGLSHVILEALSCSKPVLASKAGGNTELGLEKENLFEYDNAGEIKEKIIQFLRSGNSGRVAHEHDFFDQFKFETMIAKTKEVLESV